MSVVAPTMLDLGRIVLNFVEPVTRRESIMKSLELCQRCGVCMYSIDKKDDDRLYLINFHARFR
jgi:heterodisulfide reductase subunit C